MAASNGTMVAVGIRSRRTYSIEVYIPDAVATQLTFNPSGLATATSPTTWIPPEDAVITDITTPTAPTAVGATIQINNAAAAGATFRWANVLNTLATRQRLAIPVRAGSLVGALQF